MSNSNEQAQWRKLLQPLVTGLVALVAALTLYVQRSDNDRTDSRLTAIEVRMDAGDKRMDAYYPQLTYCFEFVKASKLIGYPSSAASVKIQTWTDMESGQSVFDETLGKTIWWTGAKWVLADGSDAYTP